MKLIGMLVAVLIVGACLWSFIRRFTGRKTCCGTQRQEKRKAKKLAAPIGRLTIRIGGMRCENCRRSAEEALNALNGVSAKISLENKTARVDFEREISDEEIMDAIEAAGFEVLEIMR